LFLNSALETGEWLASSPGRFNPGREPVYPLDMKLGVAQSQSGRGGE